jgi:hypothetical protein
VYVSKFTAAIATAAFVALLAGHSDGSSFVTPRLQSGYAAQSMIYAPAVGTQMLLPRPPMSPFGRPVAAKSASPRPDKVKPCKLENGNYTYVFTSDDMTGNVYEYCEDVPPPPFNTPWCTNPGIGGGGLAVSLGPIPLGGSQALAVSTKNGTITIYHVNPSAFPPPGCANNIVALGPPGKLILGPPNANTIALGMCFDDLGGLYATKYNVGGPATNEIDYFTAGEVAGAGGGPTPSYLAFTYNPANKPFLGYYLACDYDPAGDNYVMVDGTDANNNVDVAQFTPVNLSPNTTVSWNLGPFGPNFPGGMALNTIDYLLVSDTTAGTLLSFDPLEPWNDAPGVCIVQGFPANEYFPIAFDRDQNEVWVGNYFPGSGQTNALPVRWKFRNNVPCPPGPSAGPTQNIPAEQFIGIAVWQNAGV